MSARERDEAIGIVEGGQLALARLLDRLDAEAMTRPATIGGGDWSAKDLLSHIAYWEELAVDTLTAWRCRQLPPTDADEWPTLGDLLGSVLGGASGPFKHIEDHLPDLEHYVGG